jgi:autotransporter-associated beta strand protein
MTFNGNITSTFEIRLTQNNYANPFNLTMGNGTNAAAITVASDITGDILIGLGSGGISGNLILANNLTVTQNSTSSMLTINAPIIESGGSYGLTKNGSGTLTINRTNTYTGTTTINAGNLTISGGSAIVNNGTISLADTAGAILHVAASETIGSLQGGGATGGNVSIAASQTLTVDETGTNTFGGVILGSGGLTKNGTGTLTLNATNTYTGSTTLNAGTLAVSGNIASSGLVINSGGIISPGTSAAADSFGTSSITIYGGGYNWTLSSANGSAGTGYDQITSTGALTSSGLMTVYAYGTPGDWNGASSYDWDIFSANSVSGFSEANFALNLDNFGIAAGNRTGTWSFSNPSGGIIRLSYAVSGDPAWVGGSGNWDTGFTPGVTEGANIAFTGAGGTATNNIPTGTLTTVGDIEFRLGAGAYTLAADAGAAGASGGTALTVNGSIINSSTATQTLNTDLAFAATRTIAATTGNITIGGAISGAGGLTKNGSNKLTLTAANTYTGDTTINTGTLEIGSGSTSGSLSSSSAITNNASLVFNRSNDLTVSNTISGTGNLTKNGVGKLTLSGASSSYSGTTTLSAGTIQIGHANSLGSGGNITFSGGGLKYGTGITTDLSSRIKNSGSAILVDTNGESVTWGTALDSTNSGGLTKDGAGRLTLNATNTFTGAVVINAGILATGSAGLLADTANVTINSGGNYTVGAADTIASISGSGDLRLNSNLTMSGTNSTFSGNISGASAIAIYSGTLNFSGNNTNWSGGITGTGGTPGMSGAVFIAGADNAFGTGTIAGGIGASATIRSSDTTDRTLANSFSRTNAAAGTYTFGSAETGNLTIQGGLSSTNTNNGLGNIQVLNAWTQINGIISTTDTTRVFGKTGTGTLILNGNNTYSSPTTISAGTLEIGAAGRLGAGSYSSNIINNGVLVYSGTNNQTLSGIISGTGALTQNAASTLTLSGANTYSGGTTLNTGTLVIGNNAAAGNGTITQASGSSLLKIDTTGTITNAMSVYNVLASQSATLSGAITVNNANWDIETGNTLTINGSVSGTGGVTKNGTGTLILSGSNSYSGATVVNAGTLNAANANALGSNNTVTVNGGSLLVSADDAINSKNITFNTNGIGLQFSGNYSGAIGNLTLSANSIIDLGAGSVQILFQGLTSSNHTLSFYNWSGTTLWNGGNGTTDTDKVYFGPDLSDEALAKIYFYTGPGDSFLGSGFDLGLKATGFDPPWNEGYQIIPGSTVPVVPEPETYATGLLLLLGGAVWMWKRNRKAV